MFTYVFIPSADRIPRWLGGPPLYCMVQFMQMTDFLSSWDVLALTIDDECGDEAWINFCREMLSKKAYRPLVENGTTKRIGGCAIYPLPLPVAVAIAKRSPFIHLLALLLGKLDRQKQRSIIQSLSRSSIEDGLIPNVCVVRRASLA